MKETLPNAKGTLIIGIISFVFSFLGVGFFTGILGVILGINSGRVALESPGKYSESSIKYGKIGIILSVVSIGLSVITGSTIIYFFLGTL